MTTLFLVRHGQTALNAQGRYRGLEDPPLDEIGLEQVQETGLRLAEEPIRAVYASPLARAVETAEAIATPHGLHVGLAPGLIDIDYGPWTALTPDEAQERDPLEHTAFRNHPMSAGTPAERVATVEERISAALATMAASHPDQTITAVSHDVPIRAMISRLNAAASDSFWAIPLPNASVITIQIDGGRMAILQNPES